MVLCGNNRVVRLKVLAAVLLRVQKLWDVKLSLGEWLPTFRKAMMP
jgi:hypothetical protein